MAQNSDGDGFGGRAAEAGGGGDNYFGFTVIKSKFGGKVTGRVGGDL